MTLNSQTEPYGTFEETYQTKELNMEQSYVEAKQADGVLTPTTRQAHVCCGCCCDTRKACIVVDIINICFATILLLGWSAFTSDSFAANFDDDAVLQDLDKLAGFSWIAYLVNGLAIVFSGIGIQGARTYHSNMTMVAAIWYCVCVIINLVGMDLTSVIICGFFAYPHIIFYNELKSGVMSPETYPNEQACCCGV